MSWWQGLLFPFAIIYDLITRFRNHLYNAGYKKSFEFEANLIAVGNLSVGGTGKTPMVGYLVDYLLEKRKSIAVLSRGYGRKTKGFLICSQEDDPQTVGDEPFAYFEEYGDKIMVAVCEERAVGIPLMLAKKPDLDIILLDDAYQHRSVTPSFNILLTPFQRPFWKDFVMPSGMLRESRKGSKRADAIVVTKSSRQKVFKELEELNKPYFQTKVDYKAPIHFFGKAPVESVILVSGLANNDLFVKHVSEHYDVVDSFLFNDHHDYNRADLRRIVEKLSNATLVTTHKDAVKLSRFDDLEKFNCAYIPIKISFLKEEEYFLQLIDKNLKDYTFN